MEMEKANMKRIPIVIDTDPGVDDFFCLALGCTYNDKLELRTVTSMGGNHRLDVTTQNALDILALFGSDAPVAKGAERYLTAEFGEPVTKFHGENGLGNVILPHGKGLPDKLCAWDKLYAVAKEADGELILVTVGPVTNIAMALQKYPDFPCYIKKIVMMGGSVGKGNITPYAEANIGHDAAAADIVFSSGIPIDMIGLNVTTVCPICLDVFDRRDNTARSDIVSIMQQLIAFRNGEAMHDAVAIATLLDDRLMEWGKGQVHVETVDEEHMGQTILRPDDNGKHRVAVKVDVDRYNAVISGMLDRLR